MAIARQHEPPAETPLPGKPSPKFLWIFAGFTGAVCAAVAFMFLLVRDHGHVRVMVNDQKAPSAGASKVSDAPKTTLTASASSVSSGQNSAHPELLQETAKPDRHTFSLKQSQRASTFGPLRLRLLGTDVTKSFFDVGVLVGRRLHPHHHIKTNEALWIAVNRSSAVQLVATSITVNSVSGYWTESNVTPQISARIRARK